MSAERPPSVPDEADASRQAQNHLRNAMVKVTRSRCLLQEVVDELNAIEGAEGFAELARLELLQVGDLFRELLGCEFSFLRGEQPFRLATSAGATAVAAGDHGGNSPPVPGGRALLVLGMDQAGQLLLQVEPWLTNAVPNELSALVLGLGAALQLAAGDVAELGARIERARAILAAADSGGGAS